MIFALSAFVSAEVVVLNLNNVEYSAGESARVFGYVLDDSFGGVNNTAISIYYDGVFESLETTDSEGYFEYYLTNLSAGNHNVSANTSSTSQILTFTVHTTTETPVYEILSPSLNVPYSNPILNFTVNKYVGGTLTNQSYNYTIYYPNGTLLNTSAAYSGSEVLETLPQAAGLYKVVIDNKKTFTVALTKFTLNFKITDKGGSEKYVFQPSGVAYFRVEGYSNGQKIQNATVNAKVKSPIGTTKTVTFTENSGVYTGNTNVTQTTPVQLVAGQYEVEFKMTDSFNNEQKVLGYFDVNGLDVDVELVDKKPYSSNENAEFDITVKNLANGNLIADSAITYNVELVKGGKVYNISNLNRSNSSDPTLSSEFTLTVPAGLTDGEYFLNVKATSNGKTGNGKEYIEIANNEVFIELMNNYGDMRNFFEPNELARIELESDSTIDAVTIKVKDKQGVLNSKNSKKINDTEGYITFNVPSTQAEYFVEIYMNISGTTIQKNRWFMVQNYFSFLDVKDLNNQFQFMHTAGSEFLGDIKVFDITNGNQVDLTGFTVIFNKIVNSETGVENTNINSSLNGTYNDPTAGSMVYNLQPPSLANGFYRIEYTIIDTDGKSFKGEGWFGISDMDVDVFTYSSGQRKDVFAAGQSINVTVNLSTTDNGTATLHRDFFDPMEFPINGGTGSIILNATDLPSQSSIYGFGVEVVTEDGSTGLGDGYFEIKNLNFQSITVWSNGEYGVADNIKATVVMEKSGDLINQTNVTLNRLVRFDGFEVNASSISNLTNNQGTTVVVIDPASNLDPGSYFAELKAVKGTDQVYSGFGFEVLEDKVIITINDADNIFSPNENIEVNVKVTYQNDTPKSNVTVNLTGLLNFNTWAPVTITKQATTASNGVATMTVSSSNSNIQTDVTYAPIIEVGGMTQTIIGFGDGEFRINPFSATVEFTDDSSFQLGEDIQIGVNASGEATATAQVKDVNDVVQPVNYVFVNNVLTINNNLNPGEYFVTVTVTQGSNSLTRTLWFEVLAPWMDINPLPNPNYGATDTINFTYQTFTVGSLGWQSTNTTVNITSIENMWTGNKIYLNDTLFNATETSTHALDLTPYNLSNGDYLLNFEIPSNPDFSFSLYFRVDDNVYIYGYPMSDSTTNNVTINFTTTLSDPTYYLDWLFNFDTFTQTDNGSNVSTGSNTTFNLTNLENGFYQAKFRIEDGGQTYYWDVYFEARLREVQIDAPPEAYVNDEVQFNITTATNTYFWIIDPFTQAELVKQYITNDTTTINYTFNYGGNFMYSFADTKLDSYPNGEFIDILQSGFQVNWPWENSGYVLSDNVNFTFNVSSSLTDTPLTLNIKNLFTNQVTTLTNLTTHSNANTEKVFSYDLNDLGLDLGPHNVELILEDGSNDPPITYFFIDIFPDDYDISAWNDNLGGYSPGETVEVHVEIKNVTDNWNLLDPDSVELEFLNDQFGSPISPNPNLGLAGSIADLNVSENWTTGFYHGEINVTIEAVSRLVPVDFFVEGNDNLNVNYDQDRWEYSSTEVYSVTLDVRNLDNTPAANVAASLAGLERWPENFNEDPISVLSNVSGAYNFSNSNRTNVSGKIDFNLDLGAAGLPSGGYSGRINLGGQVVWFDFQIQTFQIDAYPSEWEYGITSDIQINVRAKNFTNNNIIQSDGNITLTQINRFQQGMWEPINVSPSAFGLTDNQVFTISDGEALIEMLPNSSALNISQPYEFELKMDVDLENGQSSEGFASFYLSNDEVAAASIVDSTNTTPSVIFGGQNYTLWVTGADNATLKNIWGPGGGEYNLDLDDIDSILQAEFTTPQFPGWYTMEIEIQRGAGTEYLYEDFVIGSGNEIKLEMIGNVIPDINFTVFASLFGEGTDPWCEGEWCEENTWFGPLGNKTVTFEGVRDTSTFEFTNMTGLNITAVTGSFMDFGFVGGVDCGQFSGDDQQGCEEEEQCYWDNFTSTCYMNESVGGGEGGGEMDFMEGESEPGLATFNLHPAVLNLSAGETYLLVFSYQTDDNESVTGEMSVQVEKFHVTISRNEENIEASSNQSVWLKTTDLFGDPINNCTIVFDGIYNDDDYSLVRTMSINNETDSNGTLVFKYTTPSLPGEYFVEGTATCNVSNETVTQDIGYFIEVGAKGLVVDMNTRYEDEENIRVTITTKDWTGAPESQNLNIELFHDFEGVGDLNPLPGVDCTPLIAGGFEEFTGNNMLEVETDSNGVLVLDLCPLPKGEYEIKIFPIVGFTGPMGGPMGDDEFGYFGHFIVASGNIEITTNMTYQVGDLVTLRINATDEYGNGVNGTMIAMDSMLESLAGWGEYTLVENNSVNKTVINGLVNYSYVIPAEAENEMTGNMSNVTVGGVDVFVRIDGFDDVVYQTSGILYAITENENSSVTAPATVLANSLFPVTAQAPNNERYKVQIGSFFLKGSTAEDSGDDWFMEGGLFMRNDSSQNLSIGEFQILSPKEPGDYLLGMPIFKLEVSPNQMSDASELLVTPITVLLDAVNVTGRVLDHRTNEGVANALVKIGKAETFTLANGSFTLAVAKGERKITIEKNLPGGKKYSLESTGKHDFTVNVGNLSATLYFVDMDGTVNESPININEDTNLTTLKMNVSLRINNSFNNSIDLNDSIIRTLAATENITTMEVLADGYTILTQVRPENLSDNYTAIVKLEDNVSLADTYLYVDGTGVNATAGVEIEVDYSVNSTLSPEGPYNGYCGDGFCTFEEYQSGECSVDCNGADEICGNNITEGSEWCDGSDLMGQTCVDFGFNPGTLACFGDCHGWDFSGCGDWGTPPEFDIIDTNVTNNETHLFFNMTVEDLSMSVMCAGNMTLFENETHLWTVGIDSVDSFGCTEPDCWGDEDFVLSLESNWTGDTREISEYWTGASMESYSSDVIADYQCGADKVYINIPISDVNVTECDNITVRFTASMDDPFNNFTDGFPLEPFNYTLTGSVCEPSPSPDVVDLVITSPELNEIVVNEMFMFNYTINGSLSAFNKTNYWFDSGIRWNDTCLPSGQPSYCNFTLNLTAINLSDGTHYIQMEAVNDSDVNLSNMDNVSFIVNISGGA